MLFTVAGTENMTRQIPQEQRPGAALIQTVQDVITRCMRAGDMARADPYPATLCLWAALHGLITLRADGFNKVIKGLTTFDEILRVTESGV